MNKYKMSWKRLALLLIPVILLFLFLSACSLEMSSPDRELVGIAEKTDFFCSSNIFCQDLEFRENGELLFLSSGDEGQYVVIAPGKLKLTVDSEALAVDYTLQDETLTLNVNGSSQSYHFVAITKNETDQIEQEPKTPVAETQIWFQPTISQEDSEVYFKHLYTLDAQETLEKNAYYRLELTDGIGSADMVKQEPLLGDLEFSHDGDLLYIAAGDAGMMVWDLASRSVISDLDGRYISVEVNSDGQYVVVDTSQCLLEVRKSPSLEFVAEIMGDGCTTLYDIHPYNNSVATSGIDGDVLFFHLPTGDLLGSMDNIYNPDCLRVVFSNDGNDLVCLTGDQAVEVWDFNNKEKINSHQMGVQINYYSLSVSPTEDVIAFGYGGFDGIELFDFYKMESIYILHNKSLNPIYKTAFSGDGRLIAGSDSENVYIWDVESGLLLCEIVQNHGYIGDIVFIPGTRQLAIAYPQWVEVWSEE